MSFITSTLAPKSCLWHVCPWCITREKSAGNEMNQLQLGKKIRCTKKNKKKMGVSNAPHQTVQLGHGALAARLADVPDFDTALASSVDMTCGVANGHGAHHLTVAQRVDLTGVARNTRTDQGVGREGHRLHLTVSADMEGVRPDAKREACVDVSLFVGDI